MINNAFVGRQQVINYLNESIDECKENLKLNKEKTEYYKGYIDSLQGVLDDLLYNTAVLP